MHPKKPLGCPAAALDLSICKWGIEFPEVKGGWCLLEVHLHLLARSTPSLITILLYHPSASRTWAEWISQELQGHGHTKQDGLDAGRWIWALHSHWEFPSARCQTPLEASIVWRGIDFSFKVSVAPLPGARQSCLGIFPCKKDFQKDFFPFFWVFAHRLIWVSVFFFVPVVLLGLTASFYTPVLSEI